MLEPSLATERMTMTRWNRPDGFGIRRLRPVLAAAMLTLATAACAHSTPAPASTTAQEAEAMDAPESRPGDRLSYSPEEIGQRFLKLIGSLESREQLTLERINEVMGVRIVPKSEGTRGGVSSDDLGGGWRYVVSYIPGSSANARGIDLSFVNEHERWAGMAGVCRLDFDAYHKALLSMGYRDAPVPGEIGELRSVRYYKGDITLSIIPRLENGNSGRLCVESIGTLS
ncbi:hypothetical protein [Luteimonas kalidii]|uniref:Lipoprotein n=1 Tax=Luteimonas kalidii TaxID=3042025 RepID=A0ABT6JVT7_9GAMM|nr:hypothetical protein [Luteimonas kalidii]MDH5834800.1 hypothetical protein [Luteimonas kalidii]